MIEDRLKLLQFKKDQIAELLNEETTDERVTEIVNEYKAGRKAYYESTILPDAIKEATKGRMSPIKVKKIINKEEGLGLSSEDLNNPELTVEDLLTLSKERRAKEKETWGKDANETMRKELTEWKEKYNTVATEKQSLMDGMDEFKISTKKSADEALRHALVETHYAKMERKHKEKISDNEGVGYMLELIKKDISSAYHVTAEGKVLDPSTMTQAKYPDEDRLIDDLDDIFMYKAKKANIIKQGNGGKPPKVLSEKNGRDTVTTENLSEAAKAQLKRLNEMRNSN